MSLLALVSWPYIRKHLMRYSLLVAGVALGVCVAVAIQGGMRSLLSGFRQTVEQMAGACQLQLSAGDAGVPESLLEKLQDLPQVRAASPVIEALTEVEEAAATRLLIIGVDMTGDAAMRPWLHRAAPGSAEVDPITFLAQPDSLLLSRLYAARHHWSIGSRLTLRTMAGRRVFTVRGLLADDNLDRIFGGNVAVMDVYGAQHVFGRGSSVDRIDIVLAEGTALAAGTAAIRRVAGPGYSIEPPAARGEQFEDLLSAYRALQIMVCLFTVALGIAMIDAAFALAVAQRRTEIGILRCLGATRRQVQTMFILEGVGTGLVGSVLGLALGSGLSRLIATATDAAFRGAFGGLTEQAYGFQWTAPAVTLAMALGIGISLLASWLPARQGASARPVEALRPMHFQQGLKPWRPRTLLLTGLLGAAALGGSWQQSSPTVFYASMVLLYLAAVMAIPSFVLAVVRPLRPVFARLFPIEGTLALDSLARAPRRTATAIAALTLVFAQTVVIAGVNLSSRRTVETWIQGAFHSDLLLNSSADLAYQSFRFPPGFDAILRAVPGVGTVQPVRSVHVPFRGKPVMVLASDYAPSASKKVSHVIAGDWPDMCRRAAAGEAVFISEALARHEDLRTGSTVELTAPGGTLRLPVAGIVNDQSDRRGVIFLALSLYQRYWNDPTVDKFRLDVVTGQSVDTVRARLRDALGDRYPASILTREDIRNYIFHPRGRLLTAPDMQLLVSMAVGTLALMNLASISVAERGRELALLRAVGGFRRQVRRTLLIELLATVGIALTLGLLLGSLLLADLLTAVERYVARVRLEYFFPWDVSLWLVAVSLAAGALALLAVLPALARLPLSVALDSE